MQRFNDSRFSFQPVIIIGAARSGTNMLRDLLVQFDQVETWPCDEINYAWRFGNASALTDELTTSQLSDRIRRKVRKVFFCQAKKTAARWLVEKTCANSLRVDFVRRIVPEAKFIFLLRDGVDVAASAAERWRAPLDPIYLAQKTAFVPYRDIPRYAARYLGHRLYRVLSNQRRLPTWGPKFHGMAQLAQKVSLHELCAIQWKKCVESASRSLAALPTSSVCYLRYEHLAQQPAVQLARVLDFLHVPRDENHEKVVTARVSDRSVGKGYREIEPTALKGVSAIVEQTFRIVDQQWHSQSAA